MQFCPNCGTTLPPRESAPALSSAAPRTKPRSDILGGLSFGVVLILLAITYIRYPVAPETVITYIQRLANQRVFLKPPVILLNFSIFFFYASGAWGLVLSALRLLIQHNTRQTVTDLLGAFFSLYCGYLLTNYLEDVITSQGAFAYFIVGIGVLIIGNAVIYLLLKKHSNR
jgi:hypothetical protein